MKIKTKMKIEGQCTVCYLVVVGLCLSIDGACAEKCACMTQLRVKFILIVLLDLLPLRQSGASDGVKKGRWM